MGFLNGKLSYSFSLPKQKQIFSLITPFKMNDNKWHTVIIERNKRKAILNIDFKLKLNGSFDEINYVGFGNLVSDGYIRLGKFQNDFWRKKSFSFYFENFLLGGYRKLPFGFSQPFYQGFQGCISEFKVDDRIIDLMRNNLNPDVFPIRCSESPNKYKIKRARDLNI